MTGRALRSLRLALSLTVDQFSEHIGIPASELDAMERGDKPIDSDRLSSALERLAPVLQELEAPDPLLQVAPLTFPRRGENQEQSTDRPTRPGFQSLRGARS